MNISMYIEKYSLLFLLILVFIGAWIRISSLSTMPKGFHDDEAYIGYNAYSLLHTARGKNGVLLPLAINEFGDYRPAGLHYLTIPFVAVLGLNEFSTRLPAALAGSLTIFLFYFVTLEIFRSKPTALIASAMLTFNPWHFVTSRSTSESIVALFFVLLGTLFLLRSFRTKQYQLLLFFFGFFSFFISFFFYHAPRYFIPFMLIYFFLLTLSLSKKIQKLFIISSVILGILLVLLIRFSSGANRLTQVSIFSSPATDILLWQERTEDAGQNVLITRIFSNKLVAYTSLALKNYGQYFSPNFFFIKGGLPARYTITSSGNFYPIDIIFFVVGFSVLFANLLKNREKKILLSFLPVVWLFIGPIPAAFTIEDIPNIQRSIMMLPAFLWIAAFGCYTLWTAWKGKIRIIGFSSLSLLLIFQIFLFFQNYYYHTETVGPWYREENEKLLIEAINTYSKHYKNIIATNNHGNLIIYYLFYNKIDPAYYQSLHIRSANNAPKFKNVQYVNTGFPSYDTTIQSKTLVVDVGDCIISKNYDLLKTIYYPDGTKDFYILVRNYK